MKRKPSRPEPAVLSFPRPASDPDETDAEQREACELQLLRLDRALLYSSAEEPGDLVYLPGGLEGEEDLSVAGAEQVRSQRRAERIWGRVLGQARETSVFAARVVEAHVRGLGFLPRAELLARLAELSQRLRELDGLPGEPGSAVA